MRTFWKTLLIIVIFILVMVVALNARYFVKQVKFTFKRQPASTQLASNTSTTEQPKAEPNVLTIPSLDIITPVQYIDTDTEPVFQEALKAGVVHYPGTALPGQAGNVYIFGHSSDYMWSKGKFKTVFALLPHIKTGSDIIITDQQGSQFTYKVYNQFVTGPTDLTVLEQGDGGRKLLTLQTSYPLGTALKRYIVQAELIKR